MKRGLELKWLLIQRRYWFDKLISTPFHTKNMMRHVLTLKGAMYNSWSVYAKKMRMSFRELRYFWPFSDDRLKHMLLEDPKVETDALRKQRRKLQKKVNAYKVLGPLGSNDHGLPANVNDLHGKLNTNPSPLAQKWKKRTIGKRFKMIDRGVDAHTPSRKALACHARTRTRGEKCKSCDAFRSNQMAKLRPLRIEIRTSFSELYGVDYGMTIGLLFGGECAI